MGLNRAAEAEPFLREGLQIYQTALPGGHWRIAVAENALGAALESIGRTAECHALLTRSHPVLTSRPVAQRAGERAQRLGRVARPR